MPTAFITGATAGIGAAFARRLAADGMRLVLLARDETRLEEAAAGLRAEYGAEVEVLPADLATDDGIAAAQRRVAEGVDLLVNNAGFANRGRFLDVPLADELTMLRVHCEAVLRLTYAALPGMIERRRGAIINVASVAAFFARGTYGASKAWVVGFSQGVAQDIRGKGVHVMALCPGLVHTEFHQRANMDMSGVPEFMWLNADSVVRDALRDLRRAAAVSVPSAQYKTLVGLGKFVPRNLAGRISARTGRRYK
ncbi:MAG TPA: SDR family oxidoreductase [Streptosporangiaceae bacterium]|nr:SDR family oxidoreductase [Streptosporangiaceae bacterium]